MRGISFRTRDYYVASWGVIMRRFMVHFRCPQTYSGEYGFDWLRDEYIYPIDIPAVSSTPQELCTNISRIKTEYRKDVVNPITPFGKEYFPAWLAIFPHTTTTQFSDGSRMHKDGVNLDLEIEEIDSLIDDGTKIVFECDSPSIIISIKEINIKNVVSEPLLTKNISTTYQKKYRVLRNAINIKCTGGALTSHTEIKVFAELGTNKIEIGKLMLYKNNSIPKAKFVVVNLITAHGQTSLSKDYEHLFKFRSFNQALIRAEVDVLTNFNINSLPRTDLDVNNFISRYCGATNTINHSLSGSFLKDLVMLYERYGKYSPIGGINSPDHEQTFLFYTKIKATDGFSSVNGIAHGDQTDATTMVWGNCYIIFAPKHISDIDVTIIHEAGHSLSLPHTFSASLHPYHFLAGTTDNVMDYSQQQDPHYTANPHKRQYVSFWKSQWDIMRNDQSVK